MNNNYPIILFDGICNLCNGSVDLILKKDKKRLFQFVTLQSDAGKDLIKKYQIPNETDSVVLIKKSTVYLESEAVIEISRHLSFPWNCTIIFKIFPLKWRNTLYRRVAKNRYKWFGKRTSCRVVPI